MHNSGRYTLRLNWYLRPEQTIHKASTKFLEREVFKTNMFDTYTPEDIRGRCFVLFVQDYIRGRPVGSAGKEIFVCESRYNLDAKNFSKIKHWDRGLPEPIRGKPIQLELYDIPLVLKRVASVFKDDKVSRRKSTGIDNNDMSIDSNENSSRQQIDSTDMVEVVGKVKAESSERRKSRPSSSKALRAVSATAAPVTNVNTNIQSPHHVISGTQSPLPYSGVQLPHVVQPSQIQSPNIQQQQLPSQQQQLQQQRQQPQLPPLQQLQQQPQLQQQQQQQLRTPVTPQPQFQFQPPPLLSQPISQPFTPPQWFPQPQVLPPTNIPAPLAFAPASVAAGITPIALGIDSLPQRTGL